MSPNRSSVRRDVLFETDWHQRNSARLEFVDVDLRIVSSFPSGILSVIETAVSDLTSPV